MADLTDAQWLMIMRLGGSNWTNGDIATYLNNNVSGPDVSAGIVGDRRRKLEERTKNGNAEEILREIAIKGEVDQFVGSQ